MIEILWKSSLKKAKDPKQYKKEITQKFKFAGVAFSIVIILSVLSIFLKTFNIGIVFNIVVFSIIALNALIEAKMLILYKTLKDNK